MNSKGFLMVSMAVALVVGGSACRTPSAGLVVESHPKTQITINSKIVGKRLQVVEYAAQKRNGLLQAQVTLQNSTQRDIPFEYQYRWMDADGMEVSTPMSTWIPVNIGGRQKLMLNAVAPTKEVADFMLEVRYVRPSTRWVE